MAKHVLIVDGNSVTHANHNGTPLTVGGMQVQAIFGVLRSLRALAQAHPSSRIIVLWDGSADFRKEIYPEYKGNRAAMTPEQQASKEAFKKQVPLIEAALKFLGIRQLRSPLLEADDLVGHVLRPLQAAGYEATLVSGDKDWLQYVSPSVDWYDPIRERHCTLNNFLDFTGYYTPKAFVQGKALQGDSSDNVPGIPKMGESTASVFLAQWKTVEAFFDAVDAGTYTPQKRKSKTATSLHPEQVLASPEGREIYRRNMKLMDLSQARQPEPGEIVQTAEKPDPDKFELLCGKLAFASILRDMTLFLRAFHITKELA